jgi:hypothetical protein|tara:strand:- start:168 stop:512 length:345 start_codon:yes stop_codon:yes gene_type:complete
MRQSTLDKIRALKAKKNAQEPKLLIDSELPRKDITYLDGDVSSGAITEHVNERINILINNAGGLDKYEDKGFNIIPITLKNEVNTTQDPFIEENTDTREIVKLMIVIEYVKKES